MTLTVSKKLVASAAAALVAGVALMLVLPLAGQQPRPQEFDRFQQRPDDAPRRGGPPEPPPRWQYRVVPLTLNTPAEGGADKQLAARLAQPLNDLSAEGGWDYVEKLGNKGDVTFLLFRRLPPPDRGRPPARDR